MFKCLFGHVGLELGIDPLPSSFFPLFHTYGTVSEMCVNEPLIQIVQPIWDQCGPALCVVSSLSEGPF